MSTQTDTQTEAQEPVMTAEQWFGGLQEAELRRIGGIKDLAKQKAALTEFNERNNAFLQERAGPDGPREKAKVHPAIEAAIDATIDREKGWVADIHGMSDDQLRDRYIDRVLKQDADRGRVDRRTTLPEYKANRPDLVEFSEKFTRAELERKEILSRMIHDRGFNVSKAKVEHERKQDPKLVALAEKNISHRRLRGPAYNDALFEQVGLLKKTVANAKAVGFHI
jgi:hypothetical protein